MTYQILVVEDDYDLSLLYQALLKHIDCEVVITTGGRDALFELKKNTFDLAIVDLQMPDISGIELIRIMRADETYNDTSILVITANDHLRAEVWPLGVQDILIKPVSLEDVTSTVVNLLGG